MSSKVSVENNEYPRATGECGYRANNRVPNSGTPFSEAFLSRHTQLTILRSFAGALVLGSILSYIGGVFLLMAFCAPYWISSYDESFSSFKNMGLWEYCFKDFRYPYYQFTTTFDGCHHIFSREYYVIREWLLPGWLMVVQTCVTLSFLLTFGALVVMSLELIRWPLKFVLQYEWVLTKASFYCISASCECPRGLSTYV